MWFFTWREDSPLCSNAPPWYGQAWATATNWFGWSSPEGAHGGHYPVKEALTGSSAVLWCQHLLLLLASKGLGGYADLFSLWPFLRRRLAFHTFNCLNAIACLNASILSMNERSCGRNLISQMHFAEDGLAGKDTQLKGSFSGFPGNL